MDNKLDGGQQSLKKLFCPLQMKKNNCFKSGTCFVQSLHQLNHLDPYGSDLAFSIITDRGETKAKSNFSQEFQIVFTLTKQGAENEFPKVFYYMLME